METDEFGTVERLTVEETFALHTDQAIGAVILESTFLTRSSGRLNGAVAPESSSTEYYLSPGLQYAAHPRFVVEGSIQLPVFRNAGTQVLRTDYNLLLGVRYLF